jgi:arsenate reductase
VLFVCLGNACRSPMAEAIAHYDAADVMEASSAGLSPMGTIPELTKLTLKNNGYTADGLTSDKLTLEHFDAADIIINMTGRPREEAFPEYTFSGHDKVEDWIVRDPFGADAETYQRVFEGIHRRVDQLAKGLRDKRENREAGS